MIELTDTQRMIKKQCDQLAALLITKNQSYGNSFAEPIRVFSRQSAEEQLLVRIDDKLNRLAKGSQFLHEDTVEDLIGYLVLLQVQRKQKHGYSPKKEELRQMWE